MLPILGVISRSDAENATNGVVFQISDGVNVLAQITASGELLLSKRLKIRFVDDQELEPLFGTGIVAFNPETE